MFKTNTRVRETSVTAGSGEYTLAGAPTGFQPFSALGANTYCPYWASDGVNYEEGIGQYLPAPARLVRTHVMASSNGGVAVDWGGGSRDIVCGPIAALAFPRIVTKSVAGGAEVTLTQLEQRCSVLILTGALTANINVIVDTTAWKWTVYNNTSGAFSLTIKTAAGAGVVADQGLRTALYCDEVNVAPSNNSGALASGTRTTFQQTAAPVGWTKEVGAAYNDAAMRIVTGAASTGGSSAFTTAFASRTPTGSITVDNHTLTVGESASHDHTWSGGTSPVLTGGAGNTYTGGTTGAAGSIVASGGGAGHPHTGSFSGVAMNFSVKYVDSIIATKD